MGQQPKTACFYVEEKCSCDVAGAVYSGCHDRDVLTAAHVFIMGKLAHTPLLDYISYKLQSL